MKSTTITKGEHTLQKKLVSLGAILALVPFISLPAQSELFKNLKTDGSIETRTFAIDNETDRNGNADDYRSETNTRFMLGANFDLLDDVHARLAISRSPRMGTGAPTITNVENTLSFHNGWVKIDKVFGFADMTIGRQFYGESDDLNIYFGPQGDELLSVTSVDLFRSDIGIANGWARFTGIAGKTADAATGTTPTTNTDTTLWGGEVGTDKLIPMGNLAAYWYENETHAVKSAVVPGNNTLKVAGARLRGDLLPGLNYHAEYIQNFGRNETTAGGAAYDGNAYFAGLGYKQDIRTLPFRAALEYGRGSNDFRAIAAGRRFGLIWGQNSNVGPATQNRTQATGLQNLRVAHLGLGINPLAGTPKLGVDVHAYRFMYDAVMAGVNGRSAGTEYDLILSWKHSDNVSLEANAATFQTGSALDNAAPTGTSPITRLGADVKIKF